MAHLKESFTAEQFATLNETGWTYVDGGKLHAVIVPHVSGSILARLTRAELGEVRHHLEHLFAGTGVRTIMEGETAPSFGPGYIRIAREGKFVRFNPIALLPENENERFPTTLTERRHSFTEAIISAIRNKIDHVIPVVTPMTLESVGNFATILQEIAISTGKRVTYLAVDNSEDELLIVKVEKVTEIEEIRSAAESLWTAAL